MDMEGFGPVDIASDDWYPSAPAKSLRRPWWWWLACAIGLAWAFACAVLTYATVRGYQF